MRVLVSRPIPGPAIEMLVAAGHEPVVLDNERDPDEFAAALVGADALLATLADPLTAGVLATAGNLRVIANYAVGYNNVDLAACTRLGIPVTNTPDVLTDATADVAMLLILMTMRRIPECQALIERDKWTGWRPNVLLGQDLAGKTLGIVGMGRIGLAVAKRAAAFGMQVIYHTRSGPKPEMPWPHRDLDDLLREADVVSLHAPLTPATRLLLDGRRLRLMKPTAVLINTARGELIDEDALADELATGGLYAAGLDVFTGEPQINPKLMGLANVVRLPHIGSQTEETRGAMGRLAAESIIAALAGRRPPRCVNPEVFAHPHWQRMPSA